MEATPGISLLDGIRFSSTGLTRTIPEPKTRSSAAFNTVVTTLANLASETIGAAAGGLDTAYQGMLAQQLEAQQQMFLMSLYSNLERTKHETQMAAVRNIRLG